MLRRDPAIFDGGDAAARRVAVDEMCAFAHNAGGLATPDGSAAMLVSLALVALGKVKAWNSAVVLGLESAAENINHERVVLHALEADPEQWSKLAPSFGRLPAQWHDLIKAGFSSDFLLGQFGQMENVAASLLPLAKLMGQSSDGFDGRRAANFYLLMQVLWITGQMPTGKINLGLWRTFKHSIDTLARLGRESPQ